MRHQFPRALFYFTSATLTRPQVNHIIEMFKLPRDDTQVIRLSNERTNVQIVVRALQYSAKSCKDLLPLLYPIPSATTCPNRFIIYANSIAETERVATFLRGVLKEINPAFEEKVTYLHSLCSKEQISKVMKGLADGELWGVVATEVLGLVCI